MKTLKGIGIYLTYLALVLLCVIGIGVYCKMLYKLFMIGFNAF